MRLLGIKSAFYAPLRIDSLAVNSDSPTERKLPRQEADASGGAVASMIPNVRVSVGFRRGVAREAV